MKQGLWLGALALGVVLAGVGMAGQTACAKSLPPLTTVDTVDLHRYMGKWYEIALIPVSFENKCKGDTTAEYTLLPNGQVQVVNGCDLKNGKREVAEGRGKVVDWQTKAKLKVTFLKLFGWRFIAAGDYWITALGPDYSYALVGHPGRRYGWVLSRTPALPEDTLKTIAQKLSSQGYDPCKFRTTPQTGGLQTKEPLCKIAPLP